MRGGEVELFNLSDDIGETTDVREKYPEQVDGLCQALALQLRKWEARMPTIKATGKPALYCDEVKD